MTRKELELTIVEDNKIIDKFCKFVRDITDGCCDCPFAISGAEYACSIDTTQRADNVIKAQKNFENEMRALTG